MNNEEYYWDFILPELVQLFIKPWGSRLVDINQRQKVATPFALRALRRICAVDILFKAGYYWESHSLIRNGYEDWIQIAYLLQVPEEARCTDYRTHIHKHDARVYDAFKTLCGMDAANLIFGEVPPRVLPFIGLPRSQTNPMSFASLADDVGLRKIHDFVYTYLSGRSHPTGRIKELFDTSDPIHIARIPKRDPEEETILTLWLSWFTARIFVVAAREFGINKDSFCDEYLLPFVKDNRKNMGTCVFVREYEEL